MDGQTDGSIHRQTDIQRQIQIDRWTDRPIDCSVYFPEDKEGKKRRKESQWARRRRLSLAFHSGADFLLLKPPCTDRPLRRATFQGDGSVLRGPRNETEKQMPWVSVYACGIARCLHPPRSNQDTRSVLTLSQTDKHLQPSQRHKNDLRPLCVCVRAVNQQDMFQL